MILMIIADSFAKANAALRKLEAEEMATDDALDTTDSEAIRSRKRPLRFIEDYEDFRKSSFGYLPEFYDVNFCNRFSKSKF